MKRPVLIENDALFEVLDERKLTAAMKAKRPENPLPRIENRITGKGSKKKKAATMYLYDAVSFWTGNDARSFQRILAETDAEEIHLHINSPGGSVFEGVTIFNLLSDHPADVTVHIDGIAASIASVIALAGDTVNIAENGMVMIHNPSVLAWGDAEVMRKHAEILDRIKDAILNTYESRTKLERSDLAAAMDAETWYSADEAVTAGFAMHKVSAAKATALWVPADFEGLPEAAMVLGMKPETRDQKPEEDQEDIPEPEEPEMVGTVEDVKAASERIAELRVLHGL